MKVRRLLWMLIALAWFILGACQVFIGKDASVSLGVSAILAAIVGLTDNKQTD